MERFKESTGKYTSGKDITSGKNIDIQKSVNIPARGVSVIDLGK